MKKKGFTLVELLAVIAILAILVIIALPNVMGMFNTAKSKSFVTEAQAIYKQVATDFVKDNMAASGGKTYCQYNAIDGVTATNIPHTDGTDSWTCKGLDMTTTRNYYVEVDASGNIGKFLVYDGSYAFAADMNGKQATYITAEENKDGSIVPTDKITSIDFKGAQITQKSN